MRDLETGTFITRDPLGFVNGPNLYTYVIQNPWTKFDPLGLAGDDTNKIQISEKSKDKIVEFETGGKAYYNKNLKVPVVPKNKEGKAVGESGITFGVGIDTGQMTKKEIIETVGNNLSANDLKLLVDTAGLKKDSAINAEASVNTVVVPYQTAKKIFEEKTLPAKIAETEKTFPGTSKLPADSQGALVSLVMNRGSSMKGESRAEMQQIKKALEEGKPERIPDLIRAMETRHTAKALKERRAAEADLFQEGLNSIKPK